MRRLALAVVLLTASGCGGQGAADRPGVAAKLTGEVETTCVEGVNCREPQVYRRCTSVMRGFRACTTYPADGMERSTIQRRSESGWKIVVRPHDVPISGWWRRVIPSRDRTALLGQWSGDCEIQTTYIIRAGSKPRPVFSQAESFAVGWSPDGKARVRVSVAAPDPRGDVRAGFYRIDPLTLAHSLERPLGRGPAC
jgi:hypothetical protein